jgi:hypothetical protein
MLKILPVIMVQHIVQRAVDTFAERLARPSLARHAADTDERLDALDDVRLILTNMRLFISLLDSGYTVAIVNKVGYTRPSTVLVSKHTIVRTI